MRESRVSVVALIVTHGRAAWLRRCIESLRAAQTPRLELQLRVGLNGTDPESAAVLRSLGVDFQTLPEVTPAEARNLLFPTVTSDWVCFVDDDAFVEPDYFERFLSALDRSPSASAIGGPNYTPPGSARFQRAVGEALAQRFATYTSTERYAPLGRERPCDESKLILCNLFVRRSALLDLKFPERIVCAEENWLLSRLKKSGALLIYSPELAVWHERRGSWETLARQVFKYGRGRGQSLRLDPGMLRPAYVLPALCVAYAAAALPLVALAHAPLALLLPFAAYALLCAGFSLGTRNRRLTLAIFPLIHLFYGLGVLWGVFYDEVECVTTTSMPSSKPRPTTSAGRGNITPGATSS